MATQNRKDNDFHILSEREAADYKLLSERITHLKELLKEKEEASKELVKQKEIALRLQAKEYKRRLKMLNGEAKRLRDMQETYLPREVHRIQHNELVEKVEKNTEWKNNMQGRLAIMSLVWSAIFALIMAIVGYLLKKI